MTKIILTNLPIIIDGLLALFCAKLIFDDEREAKEAAEEAEKKERRIIIP